MNAGLQEPAMLNSQSHSKRKASAHRAKSQENSQGDVPQIKEFDPLIFLLQLLIHLLTVAMAL